MANRKITELPLATSPLKTDVLPVVSANVTSQLDIGTVVSTGLAVASATLVGGVKIGSGLSVDAFGEISLGTIQVTDLDGIDADNAQDGDVLIYNSNSAKWESTNTIDGGTFS